MNKCLLLFALLSCGIKTSIVFAADKNEKAVTKIENIADAKAIMNRFKGYGSAVEAGGSFPLMLGLLDYVINNMDGKVSIVVLEWKKLESGINTTFKTSGEKDAFSTFIENNLANDLAEWSKARKVDFVVTNDDLGTKGRLFFPCPHFPVSADATQDFLDWLNEKYSESSTYIDER